MRRLATFAGFQWVWWAAVLGAAHGSAAPGVVACALFVALQVRASHTRAADVRLVACSLVLGALFDGALAASGTVTYAATTPGLPAPAWILAMWAAFALTLDHALKGLGPMQAAVLGAVGGPASYVAAQRLGAVTFEEPQPALVALAVGWSCASCLLLVLARRLREQQQAHASRFAGDMR
ncbi:DUF2878 domain-containing protein [Lysobacter sp. TY2-98]|uniref:DUF2878 domain-containing protein n=1 Tax=Lysobacter sp. TY2-98 TaxID=2290922 RepID=UPI000E202757|nr:DUF2878 domain-containing protein [Lysobacter sp. TY2-98]AXK71178.1 DUF2878 domain-containing protein [Lysobacter sp. TY2-98]